MYNKEIMETKYLIEMLFDHYSRASLYRPAQRKHQCERIERHFLLNYLKIIVYKNYYMLNNILQPKQSSCRV